MKIKNLIKTITEKAITFLQNKKLGTRTVSILLALTVVASSFIALNVSATEDKPYIVSGEEIIDEITVQQNEEEEISVSYNGTASGYQWEIYSSEYKLWVSITGQTAASIKLSYAVLGSALNSQGKTQVRCRIDGDKTIYSPVVDVTLSYVYDGYEETTIITENEEVLYDAPASSLPAGKVAVTVYFNYESGALASPAFKTVVGIGSDVSIEQNIPRLTGYYPYLTQKDGVDCNVNLTSTMMIDIEYPSISESHTYYVTYRPENVDYQVRFNLQNIYDDLYTEDLNKRIILTAKADSTLSLADLQAAVETDLEGFTMLYYDPVQIASDGSTVINLYFDRNYYLAYFVLGQDAYGVEPVYARYDSVVSINSPKRNGYVFSSWSPELPKKMPVGNANYTAQWSAVDTTYTVVYWRENADNNDYSYWGSEQVSATSGTYVNGPTTLSSAITDSDKEYFTFDHTDQNVLVEGDATTIVNVYFKRNTYTITFVDSQQSSCLLKEHTHNCGDHCETLICGYAVHDHKTAGCTLICSLEEHTHSDACGTTSCTHTHDISCYTSTSTSAISDFSKSTGGSDILSAYPSPVSGTVYRYTSIKYIAYVFPVTTYYNYLYLNGKWYDLGTGDGTELGGVQLASDNSSSSNKGIATNNAVLNCKHTHTESCYDCGKTSHTHGDSCYQCATGTHVHTAECYSNYCCGNTDPSHVHTSACIYAEHTHDGTNCKVTYSSGGFGSSSSAYPVKKLVAKYGQDISGIWPVTSDDGTVTYDSGERWDPYGSSIYSQVLVFISKMPAESFILKCDRDEYSTKTMNYYVQVLPGDTGFTYNGNTYYNTTKYTVKANYNYITEAEDYFEIPGFTKAGHDGTFESSSTKTMNMYYTRNQYTVTYHSGNTTVKEETYYYEQKISGAGTFVPDYPSTFEPNAYEFGGWYTTEQCFAGTEVDGNTTMPSNNILLYAKWVPTTHSIKAYPSYNDMLNGTNQIGTTQTVSHREFGVEPTHPTKVDWTFAGWFYMEDGSKKPFQFQTMEVRQNYEIFAEWTTTKTTEYTIRYIEYKTSGEEIEVAAPITARTLVGQTKHFYAKTGTELYDAYQTDWYPLNGSTSLMIDEDASKNVYIFKYKHLDTITYKVNYLDALTKTALAPSETRTLNSPGVVVKASESAKYISGYMADTLKKTLVLSAEDPDGTLNVINFYYTEDPYHTLFRIVHHVQKLSATDKTNSALVNDVNSYEVYEEPYEYIATHSPVADVKKVIDNVISITGFTFYPSMTLVNNVNQPDQNYSATVTPEGLIIDLYYTRNYYDYKVGYFDYDNSTLSVSPTLTKEAPYGATVTETAPAIDKCTLVSANKTKSIVVTTHEPSDTYNSIYFYYIASLYTVDYITVGPDGAVDELANDIFELSLTKETLKSSEIEAGKTATGSTPLATTGYTFVGWFTDSACTVPVDSSIVNPATNKITPVVSDSVTYYAKYRYDSEDLTITNDGTDIDSNDLFYFHVVGITQPDGKSINYDTYVAVKGKGSVTLKNMLVGTYNVTPVNIDTLKYTLESKKFNNVAYTTSFSLIPTVSKAAGDKNEVVVVNKKVETPIKWTTDVDRALNIFGKN